MSHVALSRWFQREGSEIMRSKRFDANRDVVLGLLAMLHDPDVEIADLEHELALDVGLSFRLLRYVNSAFVGLPARAIHRVASTVGALSPRTFVKPGSGPARRSCSASIPRGAPRRRTVVAARRECTWSTTRSIQRRRPGLARHSPSCSTDVPQTRQPFSRRCRGAPRRPGWGRRTSPSDRWGVHAGPSPDRRTGRREGLPARSAL